MTDKVCCCCEGNTKKLRIEFLYLDMNTCERCIETAKVLDEAISESTSTLKIAGCGIEYKKVQITNEEMAKKYCFLSSPTILVNGIDICGPVEENDCNCCSDISGTSVDCRVFKYRGETFEVPPKRMLAEELMKVAFTSNGYVEPDRDNYVIPQNLKNFFESKERKESNNEECCCDTTGISGCCSSDLCCC